MNNQMSQLQNNSSRGSFFKSRRFSCLLSTLTVAAVILVVTVSNFSQDVTPSPIPTPVKLTSAEYVSQDGLTIEKLLELGANRRADLQAARARLTIAEGKLRQVSFRPNPVFDTEFGSTRFLGGEGEYDFSAGVSQIFELGGKRSKRVQVAELELQQIRAEVLALERKLAVEIRTAYTNALAAARQLDVLEKLIVANAEIVRVTEARLKEGDVAPLDLNLVKVEADGLKIKAIQARNDLETALLQLKTLIGADIAEAIKLAPQNERPPRLDLGLSELTTIALRDRADLQAARLGEQLGSARINLARANAVPNITGSVRFTRSKSVLDFPANIGGGIFPNLDNSLTFGMSVDIPVFNRNQGEIASATGEQQQATRNREFLESTIKRDVAVAYRKYRAAAETLVIYSVQIIPRSEENLKAVQQAYGFGEFSVFDVVNEQRRLIENITNYNQALRDYYNALNELETALGTTIPPTGLIPVSSILPSEDLAPRQVNREKLLKSIEKVEIPKKVEISKNKNQQEEEK